MQIIPAIDLYQRQCVRLNQGEFNRLTRYHSDPVPCAQHYASQGANQLHVVDLDGAEKGESRQLDIVLDIKKSTDLRVQIGGGFRDQAVIESVLATSIDRIVLGSLVVKDRELVAELMRQYGAERFVLAFDVNMTEHQPLLAIKGWQEKTRVCLWDIVKHYQEFSGLRILCTDIGRDGMLNGPNLALYRDALDKFPQFQWQASGGVGQLSDLTALSELGVAAVIVGKALYENRFSLQEAMQSC